MRIFVQLGEPLALKEKSPASNICISIYTGLCQHIIKLDWIFLENFIETFVNHQSLRRLTTQLINLSTESIHYLLAIQHSLTREAGLKLPYNVLENVFVSTHQAVNFLSVGN